MGLNFNGMGIYVPTNVVTNQDFEKIVDTNDEWISSRTGIKQRHLSNGELTYQMGAFAAQKALDNAGLTAKDIDLVLATTVTNDFFSPSLSCLVANEIGVANAPCIDINCACAGFIYGLDIAHKYLQDDDIHHVLVVSAEMLSRVTNYNDRSTCVLFGDGAAACVVSKTDGIYSVYLKSDPSGADKLFGKNNDFKNPFQSGEMNWENDKYKLAQNGVLHMDGNDVYKFATTVMPLAVEKVAQKVGIALEDIDLIIPHQANIRIVQTAVKKLKLPLDKFFINVSEYGNTSSASVPIALTQAFEQGRVKKGDKVCLVGFGAGLTYGAVLIEV